MDNPNIEYYPNGNIKSETWYNYERRHRLNNPAKITYFDNGNIKMQIWIINDIYHRLDGPALIHYDDKKLITSELWYINHNEIENPPDHYPLSKEEEIEMKLKYG